MERRLVLLKVHLQRERLQDIAWVAGAALVSLFVLGFSGALGWGLVVAAAVVIGLAAYVRFADGKRQFERRFNTLVVNNDMGLGLGDSRTLIERLPDPLLLLDDEGRIVFGNGAARGLLGEVPPRRHVSAVMRVPAVLEAVHLALSSDRAQMVEFAMLVPVERHLRAFVAPLPVKGMDDQKDKRGAIVVLHELTAQKRLEQMRVDFVANASHELRTPLASLSGFIDTLRGHAKEDENARERFLAIMQDQASRMSRLIDDLLSLSRIELNEHVRPEGEVMLSDVVRDVVDSLSPQAKAREARIETSFAPDLPPVTGAYDELVQVAQNLVENALKYAYEGGRIIVSVARAPDSVMPNSQVLTVKDFGPGIEREHLPRLTERFYRVDVQHSRRAGGTGLGLAIVKHVVNRHRGLLKIDSELGAGSVFSVYLPNAPAGGARASVAQAETDTAAEQAAALPDLR